MVNEVFESIEKHFPLHLNAADRKRLYSELASFPDISPFYLLNYPDDDVCQGDAWKGFVQVDLDTFDRKIVTGIVISNSCDISSANKPKPGAKVLFAPMIRLQSYVDGLKDSGWTPQQIGDHVDAIRVQQVSEIVYFPQWDGGLPESMIRLDEISPNVLSAFNANARTRHFSLTQSAWFVLLIKLSIHFTRLNEQIRRYD